MKVENTVAKTAGKDRRAGSRAISHKITDAAISCIAEKGLTRITHRMIAQRAGVSLASTTYHFESKLDIIASASERLLQTYLDQFEQVITSLREGRATVQSFQDFAYLVVSNALGRQREKTIAWQEIMSVAAKDQQIADLAKSWYDNLDRLWHEIAAAYHVPEPEITARAATDTSIGLLSLMVPLGITPEQMHDGLCAEKTPLEAWGGLFVRGEEQAEDDTLKSIKAQQTRERILDAAIEILKAEDVAAVTHRRVAEKAGITAAAPTYYYKTIDDLLSAAQIKLFHVARSRYREGMAGVNYQALDTEQVIDLTSAIFQREVTEFRAINMASGAVGLEAAHRPDLRPLLWETVDDQYKAWARLLLRAGMAIRPVDPLMVQSLYGGKMTRILATGVSMAALAQVRSQFSQAFKAIANKSFWP